MKHLALVMKSGVIAALILLLTPSFVNPEMPDSYDLMWEKLESYTQKGLPRSAMDPAAITLAERLCDDLCGAYA